jgi:hypothetical protein
VEVPVLQEVVPPVLIQVQLGRHPDGDQFGTVGPIQFSHSRVWRWVSDFGRLYPNGYLRSSGLKPNIIVAGVTAPRATVTVRVYPRWHASWLLELACYRLSLGQSARLEHDAEEGFEVVNFRLTRIEPPEWATQPSLSIG